MGNEFFSEQNPENFEDLINEYTKHISQIYEISPKDALKILQNGLSQSKRRLKILTITNRFNLSLESSINELIEVLEECVYYPTAAVRIINAFARYEKSKVVTIGDMIDVIHDSTIKISDESKDDLITLLKQLELYTEDAEN